MVALGLVMAHFDDELARATQELTLVVPVVIAAVVGGPRIGGYLVAAWLTGIIVNLLMMADFYDVPLRDFGLALAALTLARLATAFPGAGLRR